MSGDEKNQVDNAYERLLYNQVMIILFIILRIFHRLIILSYIIIYLHHIIIHNHHYCCIHSIVGPQLY
jgi:hypothetical protein